MIQQTHSIFGIKYQFPLTNEKLVEIARAESLATTAALRVAEKEIMKEIHDFKGKSPKGYFNPYIQKSTLCVQQSRAEFLTKISLEHTLSKSDALSKKYLQHVKAFNLKANKPLYAIINEGKTKPTIGSPWLVKLVFAATLATILSSYVLN